MYEIYIHTCMLLYIRLYILLKGSSDYLAYLGLGVSEDDVLVLNICFRSLQQSSPRT